MLIEQIPTTNLLLVLTFRPEFAPPWKLRSHISQFVLSRLGKKQVEALIEKVTAEKALSAELIEQIRMKTDGVPLFVEELTKSVVESVAATESVGTLREAPRQLGIPATLQEALLARLDRLASARQIAQLGATLGREFSYELMQAVAPLSAKDLRSALGKLVEAEILYPHGIGEQKQYFFKHALIQDTAYQSLLKSTRQRYHQQIAHVLEERFPGTKDTQPELVAHHYTEAGHIEQAIPYWQQAGERATQRSAYVEAIGHLTKGLELLTTLPETSTRDQQELALHVALGSILIAVQGFSHAEVETTYARALELCQRLGDSTQLFPTLSGLWIFYLARAELRKTRTLAEQLFHIAESAQDSALLSMSCHALGQTLFFVGDFSSCLKHAEQGIAQYDIRKHSSLALLHAASDPGVFCRISAARALWHLGYPEQAMKMGDEALGVAKELSHPYSYTSALYCIVGLHHFRREAQAVQERAAVLAALANEHSFPFFLASSPVYQGWASAVQNSREDGVKLIRDGLSQWKTMGAQLWQPHFLSLLAGVCGQKEQSEEGIRLLAEALDIVSRTEERWCEAELYRLKGELTLQTLSVVSSQLPAPNTQHLTPSTQVAVEQEAESCFLKAIDIAQQQQAKSWELRAVMS
ncbi:MAG: hypothetical protein FJ147_19145 [Deltaproteobacteria bacterium]|nr:hypothetical protein [Deltaproteobacteria bacterium]